MKLPLFALLFCLALVGFMACDKDDPEPEQPIEIVYPEAPEINTQLQFKQAESADSIGIEKFYENNNRLFALTYDKGIHVSDDGGLTWEPRNDGIRRTSYNYGPAIHIRVDDICGSSNAMYVLESDVYLSLDNGDTWEVTNFREQGAAFGSHLLGVFDDSTLCVAAGSARLQYNRSTDYGQNWKRNTTEDPSFMMNFKIVDDVAFHVGVWNDWSLKSSTDKGNIWNVFAENVKGVRSMLLKMILYS